MNDARLLIIYKNQFLGACLLVFSFFIVLQVIFPNLNAISNQIEENNEERKKLEELTFSLEVVKNANASVLENDVSTVVRALPPEKNITAIYTALTQAATSSNVVLIGFSFFPGGIYGNENKQDESHGIPFVNVSVKIGSINKNNLELFLSNLSNIKPMSEVKEIDLSANTADVKLQFFYKPYNISFINNDIIKVLTTSEEELLRKLKDSN